MLEDTPIPNGFSPIQRTTADQRVATFQANSNSIYNKYTPFTTYSIGPSQPFVYTKISDSTLSKNLTKYDSQAFPIGSTVRDLKRIGQYSVTGNGLLYLGKQLLMQNTNAFNETRIYNPLSLLKATARPGSLGLIDYPKRHLETSGGLLNFFKDALLSTIGFETKDAEKPRIEGTATGVGGVAYSTYAGSLGGARAGLLRLGTAKSAISMFESRWVNSPDQGGTNGGFLANLGSALVSKLKSLIPSTNPLGAFGGKESDTWQYRPEYKTGEDGIYYAFLADKSGFLKTPEIPIKIFYNDPVIIISSGTARTYHRYIPQRQDKLETRIWYADNDKISKDKVDITYSNGETYNLKDLHKRMVASIESFKDEANQFRKSAERYSEVKDYKGVSYPTYKDIPSQNGDLNAFENKMSNKTTTLDKRGFSKISVYDSEKSYKNRDGSDSYNSIEPTVGERDKIPNNLLSVYDNKQSQDLIFFYFYDLINKIYVPFRATITSLSDQHSAEWEDVNYIGRADKLFLYKGFSRDVNFSFTVYANSAKEMLPMWNRINYLVGFTKPSKYTDMGVRTRDINAEIATAQNQLDVAEGQADLTAAENSAKILESLEDRAKKNIVSGKESRFIYPPMITFRLGDLFYDQPAVMQSVSVTIPDDTNWESLRAEDYSYTFGPTKTINIKGVKSRQLPMKVDVSVQLKLMEKRQALGSDAHYGNASYGTDGTETGRWLL